MYYSCMYYGNMGYKVSKEGYKLDRVLNNNQHTQIDVVPSSQKVQISDFQSQFSMSKIVQLFLISFKEVIFCYLHFLAASILKHFNI